MAKGTIDQSMIRQLAELLDETRLTEIEIEQDGIRLRVARAHAPAVQHVPPPLQPAPLQSNEEAPASETAPGEPPKNAVTSPMVGTVYLSPEPGAAPFVNVGDQVQEGQTLLIVEAMKVMNPITAPRAGRVVQLLVSDGEPVEYGEPLVILE